MTFLATHNQTLKPSHLDTPTFTKCQHTANHKKIVNGRVVLECIACRKVQTFSITAPALRVANPCGKAPPSFGLINVINDTPSSAGSEGEQ